MQPGFYPEEELIRMVEAVRHDMGDVIHNYRSAVSLYRQDTNRQYRHGISLWRIRRFEKLMRISIARSGGSRKSLYSYVPESGPFFNHEATAHEIMADLGGDHTLFYPPEIQ